MKFYAMAGHTPETNRIDFEWSWPKVKGQHRFCDAKGLNRTIGWKI